MTQGPGGGGGNDSPIFNKTGITTARRCYQKSEHSSRHARLLLHFNTEDGCTTFLQNTRVLALKAHSWYIWGTYLKSKFQHGTVSNKIIHILTPWPEYASELYRPSDRHLSEKLLPTSAYRGCNVVSVTDSYGRILGFLDRGRNIFFQVAFQLYSRGWVDPVSDPLLLRKSGSAGNLTRDI
jgi:hypothetical protein